MQTDKEKENLKEAIEQAEKEARQVNRRLQRLDLKWPILLGVVVILVLVILWLAGG